MTAKDTASGISPAVDPIAVIPARGGSKRLPGKNIRCFFDKPMIAWPIEAALASGVFSRVLVSTDSEEIAAVARQHGADTPFLRPADLAGDFATVDEVFVHAIEWLQARQDVPEFFCCIYATAPFLQPEFLRQGLDALKARDVSTVTAVTTFEYPIQRALRLGADGTLAMLSPEHATTRSQDLEEMFFEAGQFHWVRTRHFLRIRRTLTTDTLPVVLPRHLVQDIDTPQDWARAELLFQALSAGGRPAVQV